MIYVIENERGKQKIIVPDGAHLMTEDDAAYFQKKADEAIANRNRVIQNEKRNKEIAALNHQIIEVKRNLTKTDYQAIKYAEGFITETDYAPIKAQRQAWRDEINALEADVESQKAELSLI